LRKTPLNQRFVIANKYTVALDAVPKKATAYLTADQSYRLCVNGRLVCRRGTNSNRRLNEEESERKKLPSFGKRFESTGCPANLL